MSPASSPKENQMDMESLGNGYQSKSSHSNANVQNEDTIEIHNCFSNDDGDADLANKSFERDQMNPMAKPWETYSFGRKGSASPTWDMIEGGLDEIEGEMFDIDDMAF